MSDTSNNKINASGGLVAWRPVSGSAVSARHRWQGRDRLSAGTDKRRRKYRARGVVTLLLLVAMATTFTWLMRFRRPRQTTPLIAVVATSYKTPFIPNAWAFEDLQNLQQLDSETIQLDTVPDGIYDRASLQRELKQRLRTGFANVQRDQPVILYLSMHAGINDDGEACLIPPAAESVQTETWLPVAEVLNLIESTRLDDSQHALLVFECVRSQNNWYRGETGNGFYAQLLQLIKMSDLPNVHVMTACSPSENSFAAPQLGQTVFGNCFSEGLAGAADTEGTGNGTEGTGNGDKDVSLDELFNFVQREVSKRRLAYCGELQLPQLVSTPVGGSSKDLILTWCLQGALTSNSAPGAGEDSERLARLWTLAETIHADSPYASHPAEWAVMQRDLLRLEALYSAGGAYETEAEIQADRLSHALEDLSAEIQGNDPASGDERVRRQADTLFAERDEVEFLEELHALCTASEHTVPSEFQLARLLAPQYIRETQSGLDEVWSSLQTKLLAENIVRTNSHRTLQWSESLLADADDLRRSIEDHMFARLSPATSPDVIQRRYDEVAKRTDLAQAAFDIRDQSLSELFWYFLLTVEDEDSDCVKAVDTLAERTRLLNDALLNNSAERRDAESLPFTEVADQTAESLRICHEIISREYESILKTQGSSTSRLRRCMRLQKIGILPATNTTTGESGAQQRVRLMQVMSDILTRRLRDLDADADSVLLADGSQLEPVEGSLVSASAAERDDTEGEYSRLQRLLEVFPPDLANSEPDVSPRIVLKSLPQYLKTAADSMTENLEVYQKQLGAAESTLRVMAPALFAKDSEAVARAAKSLEQSLHILFASRRDLDDFYGPIVGEKTPYFYEICVDRLEQLAAYAPHPPAVQSKVLQLSKRLNARLVAAENCVDLEADSVLLADGSQLEPVEVSLVSAESSENLPPIRPGIWLQSSDDTILSDAQLANLVDNALPAEFRCGLQLRNLKEDSVPPQINVLADFRGNRFKRQVLVSRGGGPGVTVFNEPRNTSKLTVGGSDLGSTSTVVIFDCSQSMSEKIPFEGRGGQQTRFEAAAGALHNLLEQLAAADRRDVGLIFFGHRVGWNPRKPNQLVPQVGYKNGIPNGLRPYEDVEFLLPVGRFDNAVLNSIQPLIDSVIPWGETPLYLSVTEALDVLRQKDRLSQRRIIVITDGANRQTNPTLGKARQLSHVLSQLDGTIRIDIVGFQLPSQDRVAAASEYQKIASASGGSFVEVGDVGTLIHSLDGFVRQEKFEVVFADGERKEGVSGTTVPASVTSPDGIDVQVRFGAAIQDLHLDGGEHLRLGLTENQDAFQIVSAQEPPVEQKTLRDRNRRTQSNLQLAVYRPTVFQNRAKFKISLQNILNQPVRRPSRIEVEVLPADSNAAAVSSPFVVSTAYFAPETSNPMALLDISDWPLSASHAEINATVFYNTPAPLFTAPLSRLKARGTHLSFSQRVWGVDGVKIYVLAAPDRRSTVTVVEEHGAKSRGLHTLVAEIRLPREAKSRVRRVDSEHRVVTTTFQFDDLESDDLEEGTLELMLRSRAGERSLELPKPILVPVAVDDALLLPFQQ